MIALMAMAHGYAPMGTCGGTPTHWEAPSTWHLTKPTGSNIYSGLSDAEVIQAATEGFEVWENPVSCCSGFEHLDGGEVSQYYSTNDNTNVISFEETNWNWALGSVNGVIAVTFIQWAGGCRITDGDMVYNAQGFNFTTHNNPGFGETDLQSIAAHESGHWVGLDHTNLPDATLWPSYPGGISARTLHLDDETGVCDLHPAICGPEEEICDDGIDDEGDGLIDCDDPDCAGFSACICPSDGVVPCDGSVNGSTIGGIDTTSSWICANWQTTGPEAVYSFVPSASGAATVSLTGLGADLDLFVTSPNGDACNPNLCESTGAPNTDDEVLTLQVTAGETYMVVADGYEGAVSNFTLSVDCPDAPSTPPPDDPPPDTPPPDTPPPDDPPPDTPPGDQPPDDPPPGDDPVDENPSAEDSPEDEAYVGYQDLGCGCQSTGNPIGIGVWLLATLLGRRRR